VLVTKPVNVRYLTGFTGSNGAVLVARDGTTTLTVDGRYETQAAAEAPGLDVVVTREVTGDLVRRANATGAGRLGIETHHLTLDLHERLRSAADVQLVDVGRPVEALRLVKDDDELDALSRACAVTDACFAAVLAELRPGITERAVSWWLGGAMRERGAEGEAFDSIVAFGPNSAIPHHQPTDRALAHGDLVKMDFGAQVGGYHADMTRTVVCGSAAEWQRDLHGLVLDVQQRCRDATRPGAAPRQLDEIARRALEAAGHAMVHGLGHGVGLEIHESPFLTPESTADTLVERVPVTIEPGVYLPGRGGVRIEDTIVVRADGVEILTGSPRELIET
jgi:Xaa-Pro aminopeptidase